MTNAFGRNWIKQKLPEKMREDWRAKRETAVKAGQPARPLIEYADFSDYKSIIERGDNWNEVFKPYFERQENVRESLQRLYPVRIATMHARLITRDDALMLVVETRRLLKAIRKVP